MRRSHDPADRHARPAFERGGAFERLPSQLEPVIDVPNALELVAHVLVAVDDQRQRLRVVGENTERRRQAPDLFEPVNSH